MRWYGPVDPVSLYDIRQADATGVVTGLHHIPNGVAWSPEEIVTRKAAIEAAGLRWSVVESVPVHEHIKTRSGVYRQYIHNFQQSIRNLAAADVRTICYNFMPVLDWTRTDLAYTLSTGARALRYHMKAVRAFDLFILESAEAKQVYSPQQFEEAQQYYRQLDEQAKMQLQHTILAGLPGAEEGFTIQQFREALLAYRHINTQTLKNNLFEFLRAVVPVAEEVGVKLAIHPDDPPYSLFGLPRVVSTEQDLVELIEAVPSTSNGITFCTGSLGVRKENDLPSMIKRLGQHIHFLHLRNIIHQPDGSFFESGHLGGDVPMYEVVREIVLLQQRSKCSLPMRPDHGHQMLDDLHKRANPGYTAIGRLKGLAELRGLEQGILQSMLQQQQQVYASL